MGAAPWPHDVPEAYDRITIGSRRWPGVAQVKIKRGQKIDRKSAKGQHSETLTFNGRKAADVTIDFILWDPAEFDDFQTAIAEIEPEAGKDDPTPKDIGHPIATIRGLKAITIEEIEGPEWNADKCWFTLRLKCIEFEKPPPKNATVTPDAAQGYGFGSASYGNGDPTKTGPLFTGGGTTSAPFTAPDDTDP